MMKRPPAARLRRVGADSPPKRRRQNASGGLLDAPDLLVDVAVAVVGVEHVLLHRPHSPARKCSVYLSTAMRSARPAAEQARRRRPPLRHSLAPSTPALGEAFLR